MVEKDLDKQKISEGIAKILESGIGPKAARFGLGVLGGLIPIAGGAIGSIASTWSEKEQDNFNRIINAWLKLQEAEMKEIGLTLMEVMVRLDTEDERVRARIQSPEYLRLVKKAFRDWSAAESEEKRILIRNLLSNAGATTICSDDVIAMFLNWIDTYSEAHFAVIKQVFNNSGITRDEIWRNIKGEPAREDSAEADLFKLLIHDLSTGHVIHQHREKDYMGNYIRPRTTRTKGSPSRTYSSAFDDDKQYELTELGGQFVSYTMNEIVPRIAQEGVNNENK